jgi:hypothetical protein
VTPTNTRYTVRNDGPNRCGVEFWSIVDTTTGEVRATWTAVVSAHEQCDWLNAHENRLEDLARLARSGEDAGWAYRAAVRVFAELDDEEAGA